MDIATEADAFAEEFFKSENSYEDGEAKKDI